MRDTLENLYFGNITPNDQIVKSGTALKKAMEQSAECEEKLTALLEDREKTLLLRLINAENEIGSTLALENFILGFRLGTRLILEALDKDDVLLGTMEESSAGVYWMKNLEYGGVLVREKTAPEGFIPDEKAYYVEIDTDGKTYTVENEAGKGFINQALKGSLKIIKTTSDGKKEGFAFRITGANGYDMTFTTDTKGEIFIEKLRVGEYTVTELKNSASEGYKIADPVKITLVANETLTVKIHNDKTKVDVPKTGDDADLMLWISLLGLAAAGVGCTAFFYLKKRRTGKHIAVKK